jgi:hypothetical protein
MTHSWQVVSLRAVWRGWIAAIHTMLLVPFLGIEARPREVPISMSRPADLGAPEKPAKLTSFAGKN